MTAATAAPRESPSAAPALVRGLGLFDATTLIVGSVIGSGIFLAPAIMAGIVQSPALLLGLWLIGGVLTLFGALAYGELAAAMPRAGGQYVFLAEAFGRVWGFLYGWTFLCAINTGFIAAVAVAFAKSLGLFVPGIGEAFTVFTVAGWSFTTAQAVGLVVIAALTWINVTGLRTGATVQNVLTVAKVGAVAALVILALALGRGSLANFSAPPGAPLLGPDGVKMGLFAALAVAMSKALFAYDAWNSVTFAAEEIRDPERNLVRSLIVGTIVVTVAYCSAVAVYIYMVPVSEMAAVPDNRIAAEAAQRILGAPGAAFMTLAILVSTFGCVNGLILAGARVVYAMARDRLFFSSGAEVHPRHRTPAKALYIQCGVAMTLTLTGTYNDLLTLTAFSSLLFNILAIVGLFVLRRTRPDRPRPYRAWGYPIVPLVYIAIATFFLVYTLIGDPRNAGMGLMLTAVGVPFYLYWRRDARPT